MSGETAAERQKRLAEALRANLRKRKTQMRERAQCPKPAPDAADDGGAGEGVAAPLTEPASPAAP